MNVVRLVEGGAIWDIVALCGVLLVVCGLWCIYPPAALIALGGTMFGFALWVSRFTGSGSPPMKRQEAAGLGPSAF